MTFFFSVLMFSIASIITPGPNNIVVFNSVLHKGVKQTLPVYVGICIGFPALFIIVGLGLGEVFNCYPILQYFLKLAGMGYLLFLAFKIASQPGHVDITYKVFPSSFSGGVMFQWINPKAWVIAVGGISTYTSIGAKLPEIISIAGILLLSCFVCIGFWLFLGSIAESVVSSGSWLSVLNKVMGAALAISVLPMITSIMQLP